MKKLAVITLLSLSLLALTHSGGFCAPPNSAEVLLTQGLEKFQKGDYSGAVNDLKALISRKRENPYRDDGLYLLARSYVRMRQFGEAMRMVNQLKNEYPRSPFRDYTLFLEAEIKFALNRKMDAAEKLLLLLSGETELSLKNLAEDRLEPLLQGLSLAQLSSLAEFSPEEAKDCLEGLIEARKKLSRIVVLTPPEDSAAVEILEGMKVALNIYQRKIGNLLPALEIKAIEGSLLDIYFDLRSLTGSGALSIISLYQGEESLLAAAAAAHLDIPFFVARDVNPGLWKMSDNIWQLAPDLESMGNALADFAVGGMGLRRFVTLAPLDNPRARFAEAFIDKVNALEAEIAGEEWYYSEAMNLGDNFKSLRRLGFRYTYDDSLNRMLEKDSLFIAAEDANGMEAKFLTEAGEDSFKVTALNDTIQEHLWGKHRQSIVEKARFQRSEVDSNNITLSCFDGFVFPLGWDEVDMYIPQFAFYNFNTHLFCPAVAFTWEKLDNLKDHLKQLKLVGWGRAPGIENRASRSLAEFVEFKGYGPSELVALGFDCMNFALDNADILDLSLKSPERKIVYNGVRYDFIFPSARRNNQSISFYRFTGAGFILLAETTLDGGKSTSMRFEEE